MSGSGLEVPTVNYGATDIVNDDPIYPPGYDEKNGWGRLNAAGSLDLIDKDLGKKIFQMEILPVVDESATGQFLSFEGHYINPATGTIYEPLVAYQADMKKYTYDLDLNLCTNWPGADISIQDLADPDKVEAWVSSSRSTSWGEPEGLGTGLLSIEPVKNIQWDSDPTFTYNSNGDLCTVTGQLSGFGYEVTNVGSPELIPNNGTEEENPRIIVSILVNDPYNTLPDGVIFTSTGEKHKEKTSLNIFPNPGRNVFNIHYNVRSEGSVSIHLRDVNGQRIEQWHFSNRQQGEQSHQVNLEHLPAGVYFCQVQSGQHIITKKLLKQ